MFYHGMINPLCKIIPHAMPFKQKGELFVYPLSITYSVLSQVVQPTISTLSICIYVYIYINMCTDTHTHTKKKRQWLRSGEEDRVNS